MAESSPDPGSRRSQKKKARPSARLTKEDWLRAALDAIGERGLKGVAVEPLARSLKVTKGSFYWHFADRDELLAEALAFWRERETERGQAALRANPDPRQRLRILFSVVFRRRDRGAVMANLQASADDPRVGPTLKQVTDSRIQFLIDTYLGMGFSRKEAKLRAVQVYSSYLGLHDVLRVAPDALTEDEQADYVRHIVAALIPETCPAER